MIRMLRDMSIYLPNDSEFTFRRGYSYLSEEIDGKTSEASTREQSLNVFT